VQAQDFLKLGVATIPIYARSKKPSVRWREYQRRLPSTAEVQRWFRPGRVTNAAVVCGWRGLTIVDFDDLAGYVQWQAWAIAQGETAREVAASTYRVRTSRGMHLYLFVEDKPRCGHFQWGDIKGVGGYVLIPPSVHPSGHIYSAVDDTAPILTVKSLEGVIPEAPEPPAPRPAPLQHVAAMSALWPATLVESIKESTPILSFFPGAIPTGGKRWYVAHCPWHDDKHESLWIDVERGICGCYAGCTAKPLDVIGVYARLHGLDNKTAIREMARF